MFSPFFHLLFPKRCAICGRRLGENEEDICTACYFELPILQGQEDENIDRLLELFYELINVEKAKALMEYTPESACAHLLHSLKYNNRPHLGLRFGKIMADLWLKSDFFEGIDMIVPVPLAKEREQQRGYNQSEKIAQGMAEATGLPVSTGGVVRRVSNPTQTTMLDKERLENTENIFHLVSPSDFSQRHVLLVDDVVTTGATLKSLAKEMAKAGDVHFSFAAMAKTRRGPGR